MTYAAILIPYSIYLYYAQKLRAWIVDDAGISFVYARNLAEGYGLVSQPGAIPVEGYSNPLWVLILSPFFLFGTFDPIITPKIISALMVLASFTLLALSIGGISSLIALTLTAMNTSFIVWTTSGLENPLYVLLLSALLYVCLKRNVPCVAGILAGGLVLTRPEGVIFFGVYPLVTLLYGRDSGTNRRLTTYTICAAIIAGGYEAFRLAYFGEIFPNTYYGKDTSWMANLAAIFTFEKVVLRKSLDLVYSLGGYYFITAAALLLLVTLYVALSRSFMRHHGVLFIFLGFSTFAYLMLPPDWMGEFRFATLAIVCLHIYAAVVFFDATKRLPHRDMLIASVGLVVITVSTYLYTERTESFARYPTISMDNVAREYGYRYNVKAKALGITDGSLLVPDVGGTLYYSNLRVYDLGGLTDRVIARTLPGDMEGFHDYVFEDIKPTFIATHGGWTELAKFDEDPRFRRDYMTIVKSKDEGSYVRRDMLDGYTK